MSHILMQALAPVRHAVRSLGTTPSTSLLAAVTIAGAIGVNAAIFSVVNATVLRPLPFPDPQRLVVVSAEFPRMKLTGMGLSGPEAVEFAQLAREVASSGALLFDSATVTGTSEPVRARAAYVSAGALQSLGRTAAIGRVFTADEDRRGAARVAVLGHALWVRAYAADPGVVGRTVSIDGRATEIVGVMPDGFDLLGSNTELWLPLRLDPNQAGSRTDHQYRVIARLAPGTSIDRARRALAATVDSWREETGALHTPDPRMHPLALTPLLDASVGSLRATMWLMLGAVAFVLLLACANVSNLLLSRAERRGHDTAVRLALGASRARLLGDHVLEGLVVAAAGGAAGLLLARVLLDLALAGPVTLPRAAEIHIDAAVLLFTLALTTICGIVCGITPVLRLDGTRSMTWLKRDGRGTIGARDRHRLQRALVTFEVALALMLLAGAGVMLRGFWRLAHVDPGFDPRGVVAMAVSLPSASYSSTEQVWSFYERLVSRARAAGATDAGVISGDLPQRRANNTTFFLDGMTVMNHETMPQVDFVQHVTEGTLPALGARVVAGRGLTSADRENSLPVVLVNATLAKKFWPTESAIGHRLRAAGMKTPWFTVVGVVEDIHQAGLQAAPGTEVYVTHRQALLLLDGWLPRDLTVVARAQPGREADVSRALPAIVREMDSGLAVTRVSSMEDAIARSVAEPRATASVLAGCALGALLLAALGIYGVISFAVGQRTAEFAVRMALGASPGAVLRLVLTQSSAPIALGLALGLGAALAATRVLSAFLFEITATDPATFATVVVFLGAITLAACWIPARRATRVDPIDALRNV